jgi:SAM-dependent methyltransferase
MKEKQPGFLACNFITYYLSQFKKLDKVLEIGCGSMQYSPYIKGKYHGLDIPSSPYVMGKSTHYQGFLEDINLPNEMYDFVFGVGVFYYMKDPIFSFEKIYQTLKPGGKLVIFDYQKPTLERLKASGDPVNNLWTFLNIKQLLKKSRFQDIRNISFLACDNHFLVKNMSEMNLLKLTNLYLRYVLSMLSKKQWLIVEAIK